MQGEFETCRSYRINCAEIQKLMKVEFQCETTPHPSYVHWQCQRLSLANMFVYFNIHLSRTYSFHYSISVLPWDLIFNYCIFHEFEEAIFPSEPNKSGIQMPICQNFPLQTCWAWRSGWYGKTFKLWKFPPIFTTPLFKKKFLKNFEKLFMHFSHNPQRI